MAGIDSFLLYQTADGVGEVLLRSRKEAVPLWGRVCRLLGCRHRGSSVLGFVEMIFLGGSLHLSPGFLVNEKSMRSLCLLYTE